MLALEVVQRLADHLRLLDLLLDCEKDTAQKKMAKDGRGRVQKAK